MTEVQDWLPPPQDVGSQDDGQFPEGLPRELSRGLITRDQVADNAAEFARTGFYFGEGQCLKFSRTCAGAPGGVFDANAAWSNAKFKHYSGFAPRGTFVFLRGGTHGHVMVSQGEAWDYSTDFRRIGRVNLIPQGDIVAGWGMPVRGWTEDINGVHPAFGEWDQMATKDEIHDVVKTVVDNAITADNPALLNAIRVAIEAERPEDAAAAAKATWASSLLHPGTHVSASAATWLMYSNSKIDQVRRVVDEIKKKVGA